MWRRSRLVGYFFYVNILSFSYYNNFLLFISSLCPVLNGECNCTEAEAWDFYMEQYKSLFPFKDQQRNLKIRRMIQEMIEKSEDSIKEWDDHTSNSMDEN